MRAREPVAQLRGRLVGCFTVKRHQRDRDSRNPDDLSPPTVIGDECDLNEIGTPRDHGFEALYLHDSSLEFLERRSGRLRTHWKALFYLRSAQKQAKERTKPADKRHLAQVQERFDRKKIYMSSCPQGMHRTSTAFQQIVA